jgi:hypothetical protein
MKTLKPHELRAVDPKFCKSCSGVSAAQAPSERRLAQAS